jgi:hypothetical protein
MKHFKSNIRRKLLTIILLSSPIMALSQTFLGLKGGYNLSLVDFSPNPEEAIDFATGISGGIILKIRNKKNLGVQLELNYTEKGFTSENLETLETTTRKLNYIEFPFYSHLYFGQKKLKIFVNAGGYLSYAFQSQLEIEVNGISRNENYNFNPRVDNRFDFGVRGGAGVSYRIGNGEIHLDGRYSYGLGNIFNPYSPLTTSDFSRIINYEITLGYLFQIGKKQDNSP